MSNASDIPPTLTPAQAKMEQVKQGIRHTLTYASIPHTPSEHDLISVLQTLEEKMKDTEEYIGVPLYKANRGRVEHTEFDFVNDIMGELTELYVHAPESDTLYHDTRYSMLLKSTIHPLLERLAMFSHKAAIVAVPMMVAGLIKYIEQCDVRSTPETIEITRKILATS